MFSALGAAQYEKRAEIIAHFPHIKEVNMEFGPRLSLSSFWKLKWTLIEVVWGNTYITYFTKFFKKVKALKESRGMQCDTSLL